MKAYKKAYLQRLKTCRKLDENNRKTLERCHFPTSNLIMATVGTLVREADTQSATPAPVRYGRVKAGKYYYRGYPPTGATPTYPTT